MRFLRLTGLGVGMSLEIWNPNKSQEVEIIRAGAALRRLVELWDPPLGIAPKTKTNLRSTLESTETAKTNLRTNPNEPETARLSAAQVL
jgi:hypothetical protein